MWKVILLTFLMATAGSGYHILCIFSVPSRSHNHLGKGVVNALLNAGHEVTWVTPYPPKEVMKNLKIIDASVTIPITEAIDMGSKRNANAGMAFVRNFSANISRATIDIPELNQAMKNNKYDAVVTEAFFSDMEAGYAAVLQVPWILLSGIVMEPMTEKLVDEVRSVATIPLLFNDCGIPMNMWERTINYALHTYITLETWWNYDSTLKLYSDSFAPIAKHRGVSLPPLHDALHNVSILLVNSHSSFAPARSLPPNVVEIGGYHIDEKIQPLPQDLQELLDNSPQGVIYFSMGSVLKSSALPKETREELLRMFGELPYTVLWKFEEELTDLPKNVHIRSWMPQPAILSHKNVKLFITHGGLLSTLEALRFGVPLVCVPVFGDQPANAARAVRAGYALRVNFEVDTLVTQLGVAVRDAMTSDHYYNRAKYLSHLFNKRPVPPSKLIPYYIEIAIETKGAFHLRSKALQYAWYERSMLDVLAVIALALAVLYKLLKMAYGKIFKSKNKVKKNYSVVLFTFVDFSTKSHLIYFHNSVVLTLICVIGSQALSIVQSLQDIRRHGH